MTELLIIGLLALAALLADARLIYRRQSTMYTTYVLNRHGCVVETNHNSLAQARRSAGHRAARGGIVLNIAEDPTHDGYRDPCARFCSESCINIFCAHSERGEA